MANEHFHPAIEPFATGELAVGEPHTLYFEQCGNPDGEPILFVHGGPGAGCTDSDRRFFDPEHFRVVLLDQRGCGRSRPLGELRDNTTDHLIADYERLREHLGIDSWHVFGGSWGSTLSLAYAQRHPERCRSLTLRGIWLLQQEELDWWLYGMRQLQPERWQEFADHIPEGERGDLLEAYWRRLNDPDREVALQAAMRWSVYEGSSCTLLPNPEFLSHFEDPDVAWAVARLEAHYFRNVRFRPDDALLRRIDRIRSIPGFVVHGRYDIICPIKSAIDLCRAWPEASLVVVDDAGHSSHEPGITRELVAATGRIRDHGSPVTSPASRSS
ncbi:MAG: prolyl aminopeptidase [Planctomycetes bacterium]|nr:prolyl aminopeptidase [Planctomycetota bacterium]